MIKEGNVFNKTVVVLITGLEADTVSKVMCESFSTAGYITDIFKVTDIVKSFCLLLGWDGWNDDRGKLFIGRIKKVGDEYDRDCWIHLLDEKIQDQPQYPYDIIFIPDYSYNSEKEFLELNPVYRVINILISKEEEDNLFLGEDKDYYSIMYTELYSKFLDKINTVVENIVNNFSVERKSEDLK